jgi:hypothetical protein
VLPAIGLAFSEALVKGLYIFTKLINCGPVFAISNIHVYYIFSSFDIQENHRQELNVERENCRVHC